MNRALFLLFFLCTNTVTVEQSNHPALLHSPHKTWTGVFAAGALEAARCLYKKSTLDNISAIGSLLLSSGALYLLYKQYQFMSGKGKTWQIKKSNFKIKDYFGKPPSEIRKLINFFQTPSVRQRYEKHNVPPAKGVILHGAYGVGKSFLAECFTGELDADTIEVDGKNLESSYVRGTSQNVSHLFAFANKQSISKPNKLLVIIINELESFCPNRNSLGDTEGGQEYATTVNSFLRELDVMSKNVFVIGTTNYINRIDGAMYRSGRLSPICVKPQASYLRDAVDQSLGSHGLSECSETETTKTAVTEIVNNMKKNPQLWPTASIKGLVQKAISNCIYFQVVPCSSCSAQSDGPYCKGLIANTMLTLMTKQDSSEDDHSDPEEEE